MSKAKDTPRPSLSALFMIRARLVNLEADVKAAEKEVAKAKAAVKTARSAREKALKNLFGMLDELRADQKQLKVTAS